MCVCVCVRVYPRCQNVNTVMKLKQIYISVSSDCIALDKVILQLILILYCMDGSYRTCFHFIRLSNTVLGTDLMVKDLRLDLDLWKKT